MKDSLFFSAYWMGVIGGAVVEGLTLYRAVDAHGGRFPDRYRQVPYVLTRLMFPFLCGTVPWVFDASSGLMAFYLGASAPIVIDRLAQGTLPTLGGGAAPHNEAGPGASA